MKKKIFIFLSILIWAATLVYSFWYLKTGWDQPNAIMKYCASFNYTELGWFKSVCVAGVLQILAGYAAVFPIAAPVILIIASIINKSIWRGVLKTIALFFVLLFFVALIVCCLYSLTYFMEAYPLISGLFLLVGIFGVLSSGISVYTIIIIKD